MIFAITTDDKTLEVFDSESEAISNAEGIDVEDGLWLFFDETGQALEPYFTKPNKRGKFVVESGIYELRSATKNLTQLQSNLSTVSALGNASKFKDLSEVKTWLASNSSFKRDS